MGNQSLVKKTASPLFFENFDDFFRPWNEWFGNNIRMVNLPVVNIVEEKNTYVVEVAAPGMKRDDFKIDVDGNILTISSEKEENKEEKEKKFTRREYSYSAFSRSFTLPDEVNKEKIDARYEEGVLKLFLPRMEEAKKPSAKHIAVK